MYACTYVRFVRSFSTTLPTLAARLRALRHGLLLSFARHERAAALLQLSCKNLPWWRLKTTLGPGFATSPPDRASGTAVRRSIHVTSRGKSHASVLAPISLPLRVSSRARLAATRPRLHLDTDATPLLLSPRSLFPSFLFFYR